MDNYKIQSHQILLKTACKLTSPVAASPHLYYCAAENGDIYRLSSEHASSPTHKHSEVLFTVLGCPSALELYDTNKGFLVADLAHQTIFLRDDQQVEQISNLVSEYNDRAFHGPSSMALNDSSSYVFFTDSGAFGETSLENKAGSLFVYSFDDKVLRSLIYRQLAYPCGVVLSPDQKYLLVCELGENRIIRVVIDQNLSGNFTVFHQFSGRLGPSAICHYNGLYYVSLYELSELDNVGVLAVLNGEGQLLYKINLPTGPEISAIRFVPQDIEEDSQMVCLLSEGNRLHEIKFRGEKSQNQVQSESNGLIDVSGIHRNN